MTMPNDEDTISPRIPTVGASLGMKINLGNYESQDILVWLTGIPVGASPEYIAAQMPQAQITLGQVVDTLAQEMGRRLRDDYGRG